jgi:hypothetical protein
VLTDAEHGDAPSRIAPPARRERRLRTVIGVVGIAVAVAKTECAGSDGSQEARVTVSSRLRREPMGEDPRRSGSTARPQSVCNAGEPWTEEDLAQLEKLAAERRAFHPA